MVKTFFTTLASGMLVLFLFADSKAQGTIDDYFNGNALRTENHKYSPLSDSLRRQMKQLRKQLDSLSRELESIELPDINSFDLNFTPPHIHIPKLQIEPSPFEIEPPDQFDLPPGALPPNMIIHGKRGSGPSTQDKMPTYPGPKTRKYKNSDPLPDFPKWKIELLKDICTIL
ncbi:MAG TPA: hypothetical protein VEW28_10160 [Candidatus Kapabacteria bacterium]|nr:hypothetical protein [Candidatus Kapabacteria bacterium]